ncbi:MAG TPA: hypothetical protein VG710_04675 [Opitutus sp.]|nr:hypothetical protein [Opitutus sp.]
MPASSQKPPDSRSQSRLAGWRRRLPFVLERRDNSASLRIAWSELAAWIVLLGIGLYATGATALWLILKYERGISAASLSDLLLPHRWSHHRYVVGEHFLALGRDQLAAGDPRAALRSLATGVAKSPANVSGRILLAQLVAAGGDSGRAERILLSGLPGLAHDRPFLQALFSFLLRQQADDEVRRIAGRLLADPRLPRDCADLATLAAATACYFRGNYDQAEDILNSYGLTLKPDGRLLAIQIDWERGYRDIALLQLRALADEFPGQEPVRLKLGQWLREAGRTDEFRRLCVLRQLSDPRNPGPRIDFLHALHDSGDTERLNRETRDLLRDFSDDEHTLAALAKFAATTGDTALTRQIYEHCRSAGLSWQAPAFLTIEALIVVGDYRGSLDLIRRLLDENPDWTGTYRSLLDSFQAIAHFGLGDVAAGRLYLTNFLNRPDLRADNLLAVAQRLDDLGARSEARETLARAVAVDPLNQAALTRLVELELDLDRLGALPAHVLRLLAMRKPSPTVLRAAYRKLASDLYLFSRDREPTLAALDRALVGMAAK